MAKLRLNWWCYLFTDSELISICKERFYVLTKSLGRWSLGGTSSAAVEPFVNWVSLLLLLIGLRNDTFSPPSPPVVHSGGASFSLSRGESICLYDSLSFCLSLQVTRIRSLSVQWVPVATGGGGDWRWCRVRARKKVNYGNCSLNLFTNT